MDITISHPEFKTQLLELRVSGLLRAPRIVINGVLVKRLDNTYTVLNDAGNEVVIRLNGNIFYRLPEVLVENNPVQLVGKAGWKQFAGWKKTGPAQWTIATLKITKRLAVKTVTVFVSSKKLNKSI
jgi:hypothetical protein